VFGATGMTYFAFSDILGNHQIQFGTEMVLTLEDSDYFLSYGYLKNKTDYYFVGFQNADFYLTFLTLLADFKELILGLLGIILAMIFLIG